MVVVELDVPIDQGSSSLMSRAIASAENVKAAAIIINMNTPGGLVQDMLSMVYAIGNSSVPVYTYVGNDSLAASAGSYIAMATDKIYMGPGSQIGPSEPYIEGGTAIEQNHTAEGTLSLLNALAAEHGRNVTATTQMAAYDIAYSYQQAIEYHVADGSSNSLGQTLQILNLTNDRVVTISETSTEQLISFLSNATVDGIILLIGIIAIAIDFFHPTIILSVAGAVLIALGIIGTEAIETGSGASIAVPLVLFAAAAVLIVLELKTGHGFMILAGVITGAIATVLLAYQVPYSPSPFGELQYIELAVFIGFGGLIAIYARWVGGSLRRKPFTGIESMIGRTVVVTSDLDPKGEVTVDGIIWEAKLSPNSPVQKIEKGSKVKIVQLSGLTLVVEPEPIKQKAELSSSGS